jgi:capsular exopolysaccharide synthesis family protein
MERFDRLITNGHSRSPVAEAYKTLRTNLQYAAFDSSLKSIIVTSCEPGEGKSLTSANLAITIAQNGKKVLLVDCDLRKPMQKRVFNIMAIKGLTNILAEDIDYKEVANDVKVDNLRVITSGPKPPNPAELLGSSKMEEFIHRATSENDIVILDTPPVLPVTDAIVLSRMVDGIIVVLRHGQTTIEAVDIVKRQFEKVGANLLGAVINDVPVNDDSYYYNYYEYYDDSTTMSRKDRRGFNV